MHSGLKGTCQAGVAVICGRLGLTRVKSLKAHLRGSNDLIKRRIQTTTPSNSRSSLSKELCAAQTTRQTICRIRTVYVLLINGKSFTSVAFCRYAH